jgi:hypothetical protein
MKKKNELSKEDLIAVLEKRVQDPNVSPRDLASLSKRLANLRGFVKQGEYVRTSQPRQQLEQEPEALPTWFNDSWLKVFLIDHLRGRRTWHDNIDREINQYWARLSDEEKRDFETFAQAEQRSNQ